MKIRIKGNSIRIRLTKPEIEYFGKEGFLEEKTEFGNGVFMYALKAAGNSDQLSAEFADGKITLFIPNRLAKEWTSSAKTGYSTNMDIGDGKKLFLLLEKDYKCLDNVTEDQSDQYENPLAFGKK